MQGFDQAENFQRFQNVTRLDERRLLDEAASPERPDADATRLKVTHPSTSSTRTNPTRRGGRAVTDTHISGYALYACAM